MFVDASALVAILTNEPEGEAFSRAIERSEQPTTSPVAVFETLAALARKKREELDILAADLRHFLDCSRIHVRSITAEFGCLALEVHA